MDHKPPRAKNGHPWFTRLHQRSSQTCSFSCKYQGRAFVYWLFSYTRGVSPNLEFLPSHVTQTATSPTSKAINEKNVYVSPVDPAVPGTSSFHYPDPYLSKNACAEPKPPSSISLRLELLQPFPKAVRRKKTAYSKNRKTATILRCMPVKAVLLNVQKSKEGIKRKGNQEGIKRRLFNPLALELGI